MCSFGKRNIEKYATQKPKKSLLHQLIQLSIFLIWSPYESQFREYIENVV